MHLRSPEPFLKESPSPRSADAFTLLELLVVIVIIGILATVGLPAIRGMTKSNAIIAANRQLLDDLAYARQRAIADHTTVYVVFVTPNIVNFDLTKFVNQKTVLNAYTNLYGGQYNTYALISLRSVGDQPGQTSPHYLTAWRSLPSGVFIATNKFKAYNFNDFDTNRAFPQSPLVSFPFPLVSPTATSTSVPGLPYIGFDYQGQLISTNQESEAIPLSRGSILYARAADGTASRAFADVLETPVGNWTNLPNIIRIDWLTGRARVDRPEIQ